MLPKEDPKMQAKTMIVAYLGNTSKKRMRMTTLGPPPPSPASELNPAMNIMRIHPTICLNPMLVSAV